MEEQTIKVLLIEDNLGDARLLQELLVEAPSVHFYLEHIERLSCAYQLLQDQTFDIILLDLSLPDAQGLDTFFKLHNYTRNIPIVVLTGLNDETLAVKAVQSGAQDYLVKGQVSDDLLVRSLRYAIERQRTEQKIREQAALLDITTDAILVGDLNNRILFWNKGAEHLYGWSAEEVEGKKIDEIIYKQPTSEFIQAQKILIERDEWAGELNQSSKNGKEIIVSSRWVLIRDDRNNPKSILIVSTDITEKKKFESQVLRAQRMDSLGTLASGIAHDLNNILTPILSTAQLLQMQLDYTNERTQQLLKLVEVNAKRGANLVKQVLSFARGVEGEHNILQIEYLIQEIQDIIAETFPKSIRSSVKIDPDLWTVSGNSTQLHQVLMNLVVNARDAMPDGGLLTITAENIVIDEQYARLNFDAKVGAFIMVSVADTGMGINPEIIDRIFEPFFTTKEFGKGTGLGLSTAIGITKSHGGFVNVKSEVGKGTQFKLFLPAVMVTEIKENKDSDAWLGNKELVLIVDDEQTICETNKALLEAYNYQVLTASDGVEAIALYAEYKDKISLVLVDMMMPTLDGATTIRALKHINPQAKIIAVSGLISSLQVTAVASSGIQSFLPKPYTAQELVQKVSQACRASV